MSPSSDFMINVFTFMPLHWFIGVLINVWNLDLIILLHCFILVESCFIIFLCWFWHCCKTILHHCWCYYNNIFLLMCQSVCWSFIILYIIFVLCSYAKMFLYVIFPIIDAWVIKSLLLCIILLFSPCFVPMLAKLWKLIMISSMQILLISLNNIFLFMFVPKLWYNVMLWLSQVFSIASCANNLTSTKL